MNNIIAIDTSNNCCSAAIKIHNNILLNDIIFTAKKQSKYILPMIDKLIKKSGININKFNALAFNCGPGSFTGIRIGIGIAQGLSLGINIPLIEMSTFKIIAEEAWQKTHMNQILIAISAKIENVYFAGYQRQKTGKWVCIINEKILKIKKNSLSNINGCWVIAGNAWKKYPYLKKNCIAKLITSNILYPNAKYMIPIALNYLKFKNFKPSNSIKPNYLDNNITNNKNKKK